MTTTTFPGPSKARGTGASRDSRADAQLLRDFLRTRDPRLRERLAVRYLPLARYAANRYGGGSEPFDDLLQVASIGLLKAIDRFDLHRGTGFAAYALPTMLGELRRHFRDRSWAVRPPRTLQEHALRVERATADHVRWLGRSPTVEELAASTGLSVEDVLEARQAGAAHAATSLSTTVRGEGSVRLGDLLGDEDPGYEHADGRATIEALLRTLTHREREILRLRMAEDLTQGEIGQRVGLSQMHVSRILRQILDKLHAAAARRACETGDATPSLA
jgi:RNA polymerase sigma-B factor